MNYLSRLVRPSQLKSSASWFDKQILAVVQMRLNASLDDKVLTQLSLPLRHGGFGFSSIQELSPIAWTASLIQYLTSDLIPKIAMSLPNNIKEELSDTIDLIKSYWPKDLPTDLLEIQKLSSSDENIADLQKSLAEAAHKKQIESLSCRDC